MPGTAAGAISATSSRSIGVDSIVSSGLEGLPLFHYLPTKYKELVEVKEDLERLKNIMLSAELMLDQSRLREYTALETDETKRTKAINRYRTKQTALLAAIDKEEADTSIIKQLDIKRLTPADLDAVHLSTMSPSFKAKTDSFCQSLLNTDKLPNFLDLNRDDTLVDETAIINAQIEVIEANDKLKPEYELLVKAYDDEEWEAEKKNIIKKLDEFKAAAVKRIDTSKLTPEEETKQKAELEKGYQERCNQELKNGKEAFDRNTIAREERKRCLTLWLLDQAAILYIKNAHAHTIENVHIALQEHVKKVLPGHPIARMGMEYKLTPNTSGCQVSHIYDFNEFCSEKRYSNPFGWWNKSIMLEYADYLAEVMAEITYHTLLATSVEHLTGERTLASVFTPNHPEKFRRMMAENPEFRATLQAKFTEKVKARLNHTKEKLAPADNALLNDFLSDINHSTKIHLDEDKKKWIFYRKTKVNATSHNELVNSCAETTASFYKPENLSDGLDLAGPQKNMFGVATNLGTCKELITKAERITIAALDRDCKDIHDQLDDLNSKSLPLLNLTTSKVFTKANFDQVMSSFDPVKLLFQKTDEVFREATYSHHALCYFLSESPLIKASKMAEDIQDADARHMVLNRINLDIDNATHHAQKIADDYFASAEKYLETVAATTKFAFDFGTDKRLENLAPRLRVELSGDEIGQLGDEALASAHFIHKSLDYITEAIINFNGFHNRVDTPKVKETDRVSVKKYRADFDTKCHDMSDNMKKLKVDLVSKALKTFEKTVGIYNNSLEKYCAELEELKGKLADNNRTADQRTEDTQKVKDLSEKVLKLSEKIKSTQNNFKAIYDKISDEEKVALTTTNNSMKNEETKTTEKTERFKTTYTDIKKAHPTKFPRSWADWAGSMLGRGTTPAATTPPSGGGGAVGPVGGGGGGGATNPAPVGGAGANAANPATAAQQPNVVPVGTPGGGAAPNPANPAPVGGGAVGPVGGGGGGAANPATAVQQPPVGPPGGGAAPVHTTTPPPPPVRGDDKDRGAGSGAVDSGEDSERRHGNNGTGLFSTQRKRAGAGLLGGAVEEGADDAVQELDWRPPTDLLAGENNDDLDPNEAGHRRGSSGADDPFGEEEVTTATLRRSSSVLTKSHAVNSFDSKGGASKPVQKLSAEDMQATKLAKIEAQLQYQRIKLRDIDENVIEKSSLKQYNDLVTAELDKIKRSPATCSTHRALSQEISGIIGAFPRAPGNKYAQFLRSRAILFQPGIRKLARTEERKAPQSADYLVPPPPHTGMQPTPPARSPTNRNGGGGDRAG